MKNAPAISTTKLFLAAVVLAGALAGASLLDRAGPGAIHLPTMAAVEFAQQGNTLYVQVSEVTIDEWNRCHAAKACTLRLDPPRADEVADFPATGVNYVDVMQFVGWLNAQTGHEYRLPTAQEWLVLAKDVLPETPDPIFSDPDLSWASAYLTEAPVRRKLLPAGSYSTNSQGIRDLDGNVWEWTQSCYTGSAERGDLDRCPAYLVAGLHETAVPFLVRDPARGGCATGTPPAHLGLRLVSDTAPPVS